MLTAKNLRIIGLTLNSVLLIMLIFSIFKDGRIDALSIIALIAVIVNLLYFFVNKTYEQIPEKSSETKQNQV